MLRLPLRHSVTLCGLSLVTCAALAGASDQPRTIPQMLVDSARHHGLTQRGKQTAADVQHIRTLLHAAIRLEPAQADAYTFLYELAMLAGDQSEADRMLVGLVEADPSNQTAFRLWLAAGLRSHQTVEKRAEWLEAVAAAPRPAPMRALVHLELGRLALERLDWPAARREVEEALKLDPANPDAAALALQTLGPDATLSQRLRASLQVLATRPLDFAAAWQVALLLDQSGQSEAAAGFYDYARGLAGRSAETAVLPGRFCLDLAHNQLARGLVEEAIEQTRRAAVTDFQVGAEAGMFLHYLLIQAGRTSEAEAVRAQLKTRFAALRVPEESPINEVAQAGWFYCTLEPQPQRALMLAEAAAERLPTDPFVRRVLGWARALNFQAEPAKEALVPIAAEDAYAAYMLAKLTAEAGDAAAAADVIANLNPRPGVGPAADLLRELPSVGPASQPAASTHPAEVNVELTKVLAEFDRRVLEFRAEPGRFLAAGLALDDVSPGPGQPWWATFWLTNRGPFPITLGPDAMVNPVFLLSFTLDGDQQRNYPGLMTISLDRVRVLYPGQTVRVRHTIDVGPLRRVSRQTPQHLQRLTIQAMVDAELWPDGQWRPSLGGLQLAQPVYFNRLPASTGREGLAALFSALTGQSDAARARAIATVAELLGEQQRSQMKRLNYTVTPLPIDRLRAALLDLLGSDSWELRVRTLEALEEVGLDRPMTDAVERCLEHSHWLVRLMATRVLARQGPTFAPRAEGLARDDPDELVQAMAQSYLDKWAEQAK